MRFIDLTGQKFGYLTVMEYAIPGKHGKWRCQCICGNDVFATADNLKRGHCKSCGCRKGELVTKGKTRHGKSDTPIHVVWKNMRNRCFNPKNQDYATYGGRGITVCDRWLKFENFFSDMGDKPSPNHSLDRVDSDGNYEPGNCIWSEAGTQRTNQRRVKLYEYEGEKHSLKEWCQIKGVSYSTVYQRVYKLKWAFEKAIQVE